MISYLDCFVRINNFNLSVPAIMYELQSVSVNVTLLFSNYLKG